MITDETLEVLLEERASSEVIQIENVSTSISIHRLSGKESYSSRLRIDHNESVRRLDAAFFHIVFSADPTHLVRRESWVRVA
jgi:hypothetical protein